MRIAGPPKRRKEIKEGSDNENEIKGKKCKKGKVKDEIRRRKM